MWRSGKKSRAEQFPGSGLIRGKPQQGQKRALANNSFVHGSLCSWAVPSPFFFLLPPPLPPLLCTSPESLFHLPRNFLLCGMKVERRAPLGVRAAAGCASPACIQTPQPSPVAPNSLPLSTHAHACTQQCTHLQNHTAILGSKPDLFFFLSFFFSQNLPETHRFQ